MGEPAPTEITEHHAAVTTRSPADVLRLVVALAALVATVLVAWLFGNAVVGFVDDLLRGLDALPTGLFTALVVGVRVAALGLLVVGLVLGLVRHRLRLLGVVALAGVAGGLLGWVLSPIGDTEAPVTQLHDVVGPLTEGRFPGAAGLAVVTGVVAAGAPWVSRRWRRAGWTFVVAVALVRFVSSPVAFDTLTSFLAGWVAGSAVVVLFGAPSRRPTGAAIAEGLAAVGVPLATLEQADLDARGSTPFFGRTPDGTRLFVKAVGEDERSADLLFRLYRKAIPRNLGDERPFSTLRRAVEHEYLLSLAARDHGVRTPRLVAMATAEPNAFVLASEAIPGRSLDRLEPAEVTDEVLAAVWAQIVLLRARRIAHRDLRLANVFLADDGVAWMIDFGFSELAASDTLLATDLAELLASSSLPVGVDRAVAAAVAAVGPADLASASARLVPYALSGATRTALKARPGHLDELRAAVTATAGGAGTGAASSPAAG